MRVRKKGTGSSSHGHEWTEPGQVLDIPAEDAAELVAIAPGEFEALPDEPEPAGAEDSDPDGPPAQDDAAPETEDAAQSETPKQRASARRTAVTEA